MTEKEFIRGVLSERVVLERSQKRDCSTYRRRERLPMGDVLTLHGGRWSGCLCRLQDGALEVYSWRIGSRRALHKVRALMEVLELDSSRVKVGMTAKLVFPVQGRFDNQAWKMEA